MDKVRGSMEALSAMQLTEEMDGLDAQSKAILRSKEVLAVILQNTVEEYKGYSRKEIMEFIEADSMSETKEVSPGRTNTQVRGDSAEFAQLNEKVSMFDLLFRAKNPKLSNEDMLVNLHVDLEPQKTYRPGYPVEKRGIYYLARQLSAQLSLVTEGTDYGQLEKCYSIWICCDDIPKNECYSVSFYEIANTKNIGVNGTEKENYDLITLVIIKLGDMVYTGEKGSEGYELLRFLNAIMYPHQEDFMEVVSEYIDFSDNDELWKETKKVRGIGQRIAEEVWEEASEKTREEGIQILVLDNLEEQIPEERILVKLQRHYNLTEEKAKEYYDRFAVEA